MHAEVLPSVLKLRIAVISFIEEIYVLDKLLDMTYSAVCHKFDVNKSKIHKTYDVFKQKHT